MQNLMVFLYYKIAYIGNISIYCGYYCGYIVESLISFYTFNLKEIPGYLSINSIKVDSLGTLSCLL